MTAQEIADAIAQGVVALLDGETSLEEHAVNNKALWTEAHTLGVASEVSAILQELAEAEFASPSGKL